MYRHSNCIYSKNTHTYGHERAHTHTHILIYRQVIWYNYFIIYNTDYWYTKWYITYKNTWDLPMLSTVLAKTYICLVTPCSLIGERFTKDLGHPKMGYPNYHLVITQIWANQSQQNFAHATTAMLSWHVQNFVVIKLLKLGLVQISS